MKHSYILFAIVGLLILSFSFVSTNEMAFARNKKANELHDKQAQSKEQKTASKQNSKASHSNQLNQAKIIKKGNPKASTIQSLRAEKKNTKQLKVAKSPNNFLQKNGQKTTSKQLNIQPKRTFKGKKTNVAEAFRSKAGTPINKSSTHKFLPINRLKKSVSTAKNLLSSSSKVLADAQAKLTNFKTNLAEGKTAKKWSESVLKDKEAKILGATQEVKKLEGMVQKMKDLIAKQQ